MNTEKQIWNLHVGGDQQPASTKGKKVIYRCKFVEAFNLPHWADELDWARVAEYRIIEG